MKKFFTIFILLAMIGWSSNLFSQQWTDDFESYSAGSFPSSNWVDDGNTGGVVDNTIFHGGSQSLRLYGVLGSFGAEIAHHSIGTSSPWHIECWVRNGDETIPSGGHQERASLDLHSQPDWSSDQRNLIYFYKDGHIYGGANEDLGTYSTLTWYKVAVQYEYPVSGQVRLTYWLNNTQIGQTSISPYTYEANLAYIGVSAQAGTVWYDDVKVCNSIIITNVAEIFDNQHISIYPNPANDNITIENTRLGKNEIISIYNIQGQLLIQQLLRQAKTEINISKLAKGLYILKAGSQEGIAVKRFIKE